MLPCQRCIYRLGSGSCSFRRLIKIAFDEDLILNYVEKPRTVQLVTIFGTFEGDPEEMRQQLCKLVFQPVEEDEDVPVEGLEKLP